MISVRPFHCLRISRSTLWTSWHTSSFTLPRFLYYSTFQKREQPVKLQKCCHKLRAASHRNNLLTVPNAISLGRMAVSPLLAYFVVTQQLAWAIGLVLVSGISDAVDGYVARRFPGQRSWLGSYLDPIADKVLITTLALSMTTVQLFPALATLAILIITRDLTIVLMAGYFSFLSIPQPTRLAELLCLHRVPIEMKASNISKLNTGCQLFTITFSLAAPLLHLGDSIFLQGLWFLTAGTTVASGVDYLRQLPSWNRKAIEMSRNKTDPNREQK
ncbi:Phosphatidylglycerophosphate synthase [Paragonimus heterotremus]|uniref:cardiolipin synthase (CMP-forming) n=1 Tax=Paragonimus heterotremus TaxID=100268 RepID=A0A8J4WFM1_9TREM|nr:Phosphatidylglycerophosphate synthase [Paragonimus heterotremus]